MRPDHDENEPLPSGPAQAQRFGFVEADWQALSDDEQHAFRHYGEWVIPHTGATVSEIVAMVSRNTDLRPSAVSIFIAWLEGERLKWCKSRNCPLVPRLKTAPPFQMSDDRWLWINSLRESRNLPWIHADQWERISENVRSSLAVGLLPPGAPLTANNAPKLEKAPTAGDADDDENVDYGDVDGHDDAHGGGSAVSGPARMPTWRPGSQATPNAFARSATFSVIEKGKRRTLGANGTPDRIAAWSGTSIEAIGEQLCQADHCTFQAIVSRAKLQSLFLDKPIEFDPRVLLREMGRQTSRWNRDWLVASIGRLAALQLSVRSKGRHFAGTLLIEFQSDPDTKRFQVSVNPDVVELFADGGWTQLPRVFRQAVIGHPLAAWLTTFFGSHAATTGIRIDTLMKLSGSRCKRERLFRRRLTMALDACITASEAGMGQITSYDFANGLLYVSTNVSATQERHLTRKTRGRPRLTPQPSSSK
jgi:hypothetical protein